MSQISLAFSKTVAQNYEAKVTSGTGYGATYYSNNNYPNINIEVLTVNYYDDYNFNLAGTFNPTTNNTLIYGGYPTLRTKGLATGSKVKVLTTSNWITTVSYYDEKARPLRTYSYNDYLKSTDLVSNDLDFVGKVKEMTSSHTYINGSLATIITEDVFTYDNSGRLLTQNQTIGAHTETIVANTYDDLGQLVSKGVGGKTTQSRLQTVDYTYSIRGWLKNINQDAIADNDLFNLTLKYNNPDNPSKALFNGNISQIDWSTLSVNTTSNPVSNTYTYSYDALNRIISGIDNTGNYNLTAITYDKNGNITSLERRGHTNVAATTFGVMDDLTYTYMTNSNKLLKVDDSPLAKDYGFRETTTGNDYTYDGNGNMKTDANKGITNILYNHLNLPKQVTINGQNILYVYDATGVKLRKTVNTTTTDYAGNFIYENNVLQFFSQPEGYIEPNGSNFNYVYQYKDHLGNIRLSYTDVNQNNPFAISLSIKEENNYYPFGLKHKT